MAIGMDDEDRLTVHASNKNYSGPYSESNGFVHDPVPGLSENKTERPAVDTDRRFDPVTIRDIIAPTNAISIECKPLRQDPYDGRVRMHPIEVVIDAEAVEAMHQQALEACPDGPREVKETGGFLGGIVCKDQHDRHWIHIKHSAHDPPLIGDEVSLTYDVTTKQLWEHDIRNNQGLLTVGFWHSHPGYEPFQSDERTWSSGADVQTTYALCKSWWSVALVIDPFSAGEDATMLGVYRPISPNAHGTAIQPWYGGDPPTSDRPEIIGWRSVNFAVNKRGTSSEE